MPDDDERWAQAASLLAGAPTPAAEQHSRDARRRAWALVAVIAVLGIGFGILLVVVLGGTGNEPDVDVPTWRAVCGVALAAFGLVVELAAVVGVVRTNRRNGGWRNPLTVLTRAQRKGLLAQVRGRQPFQPAQAALARRLAVGLVDVRRSVVLQAGLATLWIGLYLIGPTTWNRVLAIGYPVLVAVMAVLTERDVRRAQHFLATH